MQQPVGKFVKSPSTRSKTVVGTIDGVMDALDAAHVMALAELGQSARL